MWVLQSSTYLQKKKNWIFMGTNMFTARILCGLKLCSLWSRTKWRYFWSTCKCATSLSLIQPPFSCHWFYDPLVYIYILSRDSSVGIVTGYELDDRDLIPGGSKRVFLMIIIFWEMTPCGSYKNRRFGGSYRLHPQDARVRAGYRAKL
jgi:hypothetical protein